MAFGLVGLVEGVEHRGSLDGRLLHAVDRDAEPIEIAHYQFGEDFATFWQKKASTATQQPE